VIAAYRDLAQLESKRVVLIDGSKSADAIEAEIWETLSKRFPQLSESSLRPQTPNI
jgi:thymidylate kinase